MLALNFGLVPGLLLLMFAGRIYNYNSKFTISMLLKPKVALSFVKQALGVVTCLFLVSAATYANKQL